MWVNESSPTWYYHSREYLLLHYGLWSGIFLFFTLVSLIVLRKNPKTALALQVCLYLGLITTFKLF